jgi:hypothetical protein
MTPLVWLAIPVVVTLIAAVLLPRRTTGAEELTPRQRAAIVARALGPDSRRRPGHGHHGTGRSAADHQEDA